jgi:anti-anti-sigma factor
MEFMNTFSIKTVGDTVTIILCARLDANNTTPLMDELQKCIGKGFKKVIYDCRGLEYVSSAGLRPFIFSKQKVVPDGDVEVLGAQDAVSRVIKMCGFESFLKLT